MVVWFEEDFSEGTPGQSINGGDTPNFTLFDWVPSPVDYLNFAEVAPGILGVKPRSTGWADFGIDLDGRTETRLGFRVKFLEVANAAATSVWLASAWRSAENTVLADFILRNSSGSRYPAHRLAFSYVAPTPATDLFEPDDIISVEAYQNGTSYTLQMWDGEDTSAPATYTWSGTLASTPADIMFGPDANSGVDAIIYDVWVSDGERRNNEPEPGVVQWAHNGYARVDEFSVNLKVDNEISAGIEYDTDPGFSNPTTAVGVDKLNGYWIARAQSLSPDTTYYWRATVNGGVSAVTGKSKTFPSSGMFTFGWGSCFDVATSQVFSLIANRNPDTFFMLGDYGYQYITGGANGNTSPTDAATVRAHREPVLEADGSRTLFANVPMDYTYSDCDGAGANSDGTTGGHATGAVQEAYRQQFAHPPLECNDSGARAFSIGSVRYIHTDETADASLKTATDDANKSKLGDEQKLWFLEQIDEAAAAKQVVIWLGDGGWIGPAGGGGATGNGWMKYDTERQELASYISNAMSSGLRGFIRLHGDDHSLYLDDGTNNIRGGFPVVCAAPMHTTANVYSSPTTGGSWPEAQTNSSRQYGIAEVTDDGVAVTVKVIGYSSTNSAPTEVVRYEETFMFGPVLGVWNGTSVDAVEVLGVISGGSVVPVEYVGLAE